MPPEPRLGVSDWADLHSSRLPLRSGAVDAAGHQAALVDEAPVALGVSPPKPKTATRAAYPGLSTRKRPQAFAPVLVLSNRGCCKKWVYQNPITKEAFAILILR